MDRPQNNVTELLQRWSDGDSQALDGLVPLIYDDLHRLAGRYLRHERNYHTLQTTALVNEAYLRLVNQNRVSWQNRNQFLAVAAKLMRQILVDYARRRGAAKRGGERLQLSLGAAEVTTGEERADLLGVDEALSRLEALDQQQSRVVELRVFGGLTVEETADALGISPRTVKREWAMAKAWLRREISKS